VLLLLLNLFNSQDNLGKPVPERQNQSGLKWGKRWQSLGMQWHQLDHMQTYALCSRQITTSTTHHSIFTNRDHTLSYNEIIHCPDALDSLLAQTGLWNQAVLFATSQRVTMPGGREGNCMLGIALVMQHRHQWFIHILAHGLRNRDENPT